MVYEYTNDVAKALQEEGDLVSCFLCTGHLRVSFSPFKKYLQQTDFYRELKEPKPSAPYIYQTKKVLVFMYKQRVFKRISLLETFDLFGLLVNKCRELGIKKLLLPINTFLIEGIAMKELLIILKMVDTEGVDIYYF